MDISERERLKIRERATQWLSAHGDVLTDAVLDDDLPWRPHLYCPCANIAVHLLLYPSIRDDYLDVFNQARARIDGLTIVVVGPIQFILSSSVLESGHRAEPHWVLMEECDRGVSYREYDTVLSLIYNEELLLPGSSYESIARLSYDRLLKATGQEKGRRLEHFLAFLFSQVPGFRVLGTTYRTATEEIDIVLQNRRTGGILDQYSAPLILAESKNQTQRADKNAYVQFANKIRNRRQAVKIGFFISLSGYTRDCRLEALRDSREFFVIARLDSKDVERWITASGEPSSKLLESFVSRAMLE